jgi:ATP-dependent DNA helicase RecG
MVIEHAERFGLSALHQLRGRIGRGSEQSYCFLIYSENITEDAIKRLKVLYSTSDGFALAEEDLKLRGPGELLGTAQSGPFQLKIANPVRDFDLLKTARADAFALVKNDPGFLSLGHTVYRKIMENTDTSLP